MIKNEGIKLEEKFMFNKKRKMKQFKYSVLILSFILKCIFSKWGIF